MRAPSVVFVPAPRPTSSGILGEQLVPLPPPCHLPKDPRAFLGRGRGTAHGVGLGNSLSQPTAGPTHVSAQTEPSRTIVPIMGGSLHSAHEGLA